MNERQKEFRKQCFGDSFDDKSGRVGELKKKKRKGLIEPVVQVLYTKTAGLAQLVRASVL